MTPAEERGKKQAKTKKKKKKVSNQRSHKKAELDGTRTHTNVRERSGVRPTQCLVVDINGLEPKNETNDEGGD
jgi:hypothetical protein